MAHPVSIGRKAHGTLEFREAPTGSRAPSVSLVSSEPRGLSQAEAGPNVREDHGCRLTPKSQSLAIGPSGSLRIPLKSARLTLGIWEWPPFWSWYPLVGGSTGKITRKTVVPFLSKQKSTHEAQ